MEAPPRQAKGNRIITQLEHSKQLVKRMERDLLTTEGLLHEVEDVNLSLDIVKVEIEKRVR